MKPPYLRKKMLFLLVLVITSLCLDLSESYTEIEILGLEIHRRILHQPLFPATTPTEPPPSSSSSTQIPDPSKQPFIPETPNGTQTPPDQTPTTPTTSTPSPLNVTPQVPIATSASNPTKKVAVAISVGIVTLGMLSALAFFLYKHRHKHSNESSSQKLVGTRNSQQQQQQESMPPTSEFLYLGTMEPTSNGRVSNSSDTNNYSNGSPYHKLQSLRRSELNHPSPELQPLPPLTRNPLGGDSSPPNISYEAPYRTSPSAMSSEDTFYSPQNSAVGESPPVPRQIFFGNFKSSVISTTPHSKRSSPKSRLSISSSPDVKLSELTRPPPPPPPPPPPLQPPKNQVPRRNTKYQSPPGPPPNLIIPKAVNDTRLQNLRSSSVPLAPRPPPPPPPLGTARSLGAKDSSVPRPQFVAHTPKPAVRTEIPSPVEEEHNELEDGDGAKPKLRPLHWDKVRATSDRVMVWDQLNSGSFQVNEDMIETLFGQNQAPTESNRRSSFPPVPKENQVLDPKKSQNIAILLRALNVTQHEVSEALLDGNPEGLGAELLETLVKMAPTKEEELKLINYSGDLSKLGSAERFLKAVLDIPFAFRRVDAMLYRANFEAEINYLRKSFETLEAACGELRNSRLFLKLLEAVLQTGNRMNVGTNRGDARAFKLDTLLKLVDIKGTDGKTTLLHFVVQEIIRYEGASSKRALKEDDVKKQGLQVVAALSRELGNVKKAAGMDSDVLSCYLLKLEKGLEKVRLALQNENSKTEGNFFGEMILFLSEATEEILRVKADEKKTLSHVKEVTEYFHGDTAKEEPHPFRVFMIVRDFLSVLDHVCKEVGELKNRTMVGAARSFRVPAITSLPVLNRFNIREQGSPDWDTMSP